MGRMKLALIAHDGRKKEMVALAGALIFHLEKQHGAAVASGPGTGENGNCGGSRWKSTGRFEASGRP